MTAENVILVTGVLISDDASMRPRPMTAENSPDRRGAPCPRSRASMRPRPMTAENTYRTRPEARLSGCCFNEAAADDRGKRTRRTDTRAGGAASMRPRPMTAENVPSTREGVPNSLLQ